MSKDVKFLENLIRNFEGNESISLDEIETAAACGENDNFLSNVSRLKVKGVLITDQVQQEYCLSLIIKENKPDFEGYGEYPFKNEAIAYKEIFPALRKLSKADISIPKCIFANEQMTVLEDLGSKGFKCANRLNGLSLEQIGKVVSELASLHAASISLEKSNKDIFSYIINHTNDYMYGKSAKITEMLKTQEDTIPFAIKLLKTFDPTNISGIEKLQGFKDTINRNKFIINKERRVRAINHGDCWSSNILFNDNNDLVMIDFQCMRYTSVAADLTYFLYVSLDPRSRKENMDSFLQIYLNQLKTCLDENNVKLDLELDNDWLEGEMKEFRFFGFVNALWLMPIFFECSFTEKDDFSASEAYRNRCLETIYEFIDHL